MLLFIPFDIGPNKGVHWSFGGRQANQADHRYDISYFSIQNRNVQFAVNAGKYILTPTLLIVTIYNLMLKCKDVIY